MREITIGPLDAGQRLDKFLMRYFKEAEKGFLYRMLRKKNILLNDKKAAGSEQLLAGDVLKVFFSEETFEEMRGKETPPRKASPETQSRGGSAPGPKAFSVIYEDPYILIVNKPAGLLSQKAAAGDQSLSEMIATYLRDKAGESSLGFTPSVAHRLDRNTSGLVMAGKNLPGQQLLTYLLRERLVDKYYLALVKGRLSVPLSSVSYWRKDRTDNRVTILDKAEADTEKVELIAYPAENLEAGFSLLKVRLISGKSHQIRAQLARAGYPIIGDTKYGDTAFNRELAARLGRPFRVQLLHSHEVVFPRELAPRALSTEACKAFEAVKGKGFKAKPPVFFKQVVVGLGGHYGE